MNVISEAGVRDRGEMQGRLRYHKGSVIRLTTALGDNWQDPALGDRNGEVFIHQLLLLIV